MDTFLRQFEKQINLTEKFNFYLPGNSMTSCRIHRYNKRLDQQVQEHQLQDSHLNPCHGE